jgi:hypothetical protein
MYNKHNLKYKGSDVRFLTNIEFKKRMNLLNYQKLNNLFNAFVMSGYMFRFPEKFNIIKYRIIKINEDLNKKGATNENPD